MLPKLAQVVLSKMKKPALCMMLEQAPKCTQVGKRVQLRTVEAD
jgi:hypothetical protein